MKALVITPKNDSEFKFLIHLLKKLGMGSSTLTAEDIEDIGISKLLKDVDKTQKSKPCINYEKVIGLMKVEILKNFSKDIDNLKLKSVKQTLMGSD